MVSPSGSDPAADAELPAGAAPLPLDGAGSLDFGAGGLVPAIVQDVHTRQVLMLGYMSREMLLRTLETGTVWFWSRSRGEPWQKGATSGNYLLAREVRRNCYDNSLLVLVEPVGPTCHTGAVSCFYRTLAGDQVDDAPLPLGDAPVGEAKQEPADGSFDLMTLFEIVEQRRRERPEGSYVAQLLDQGLDRIAKKLGEEATEVIIAAKNRSQPELAHEMADLWFFCIVLLSDAGMTPLDVFRVLAGRHRPSPP